MKPLADLTVYLAEKLLTIGFGVAFVAAALWDVAVLGKPNKSHAKMGIKV